MTGIVLPSSMSRGELTVRLWRPDDVPALAAAIAANLDWLRPWLPWVGEEPLELERRHELVRRWREQHAAGLDATYGIFLDGEIAGGTGLHQRIGPGGLEIGYWVAGAVARRRVATTTAALLTLAGLAAFGVDRIEIHHAVENHRSAGVPQLLGYRRCGPFMAEPLGPGLSGERVRWRLRTGDVTPALHRRLSQIEVR